LTYWHGATRGATFCLIDAPDRAAAERVQEEARGHVANKMIEVDLSAAEAFLERTEDPPSAKTEPGRGNRISRRHVHRYRRLDGDDGAPE